MTVRIFLSFIFHCLLLCFGQGYFSFSALVGLPAWPEPIYYMCIQDVSKNDSAFQSFWSTLHVLFIDSQKQFCVCTDTAKGYLWGCDSTRKNRCCTLNRAWLFVRHSSIIFYNRQQNVLISPPPSFFQSRRTQGSLSQIFLSYVKPMY